MTPSPVVGGVSARAVVLALFGLFALDTILLLPFLGLGAVAVTAAIALAGLLLWMIGRALPAAGFAGGRIGWRTLATCLGAAVLLLLLGGEGRLFYANADWQVRDAVLHDMASHPWPFAYALPGGPWLLRAPIGMYLLPALLGGSDLALLASNTAKLALILAAGSLVFETARARAIALIVFIAASGLDIIGTLLFSVLGIRVLFASLEGWAFGTIQYSSIITLAFWVPPHAFAGWFCAVAFLLWQQRRLPLGAFAAALPLAAIWSPLALLGAIPLVGYAAIRAVREGEWAHADIAIATVAALLAAPALLYLTSAAAAVGFSLQPLPFVIYALFLAIDLLPLALIALWRPGRFGSGVAVLVVAMLMAIPFGVVGVGQDFVMRASIPALAVLAVIVGDAVATAWAAPVRRRAGLPVMLAVLGIGAVTGGVEIARALRYPPSPPPRCSLPGAWQQQTQRIKPIVSYLAPVAALPPALRPRDPALIDPGKDPAQCWDYPWPAQR